MLDFVQFYCCLSILIISCSRDLYSEPLRGNGSEEINRKRIEKLIFKDVFFVLNNEKDSKDIIQSINHFINKKEWDEALKALMKLKNDFSKSMISVPGNKDIYKSLYSYENYILSKFPISYSEKYKSSYDAEAQSLFKEFEISGNIKSLKKIESEYFLSRIGPIASNILAEKLFESNQLTQAIFIWNKILDYYSSYKNNEKVISILTKLAICYYKRGRMDLYGSILEKIENEYLSRKIILGGRYINPLVFLEKNIQFRNMVSKDYLSYSGSSRLGETNYWSNLNNRDDSYPDKKKWSYKIKNYPIKGYKQKGLLVPNNNYPAISDGIIYFNNMNEVSAIDLKSGMKRWDYIDKEISDNRYLQLRDLEYTPIVVDNLVCVRMGKKYKCFDKKTGKLLWEKREIFKGKAVNENQSSTDFSTSLVSVSSVFVAGILKVKGEIEVSLVGIEAATGKIVWNKFIVGSEGKDYLSLGNRPSLPSAYDGLIYFSTNLGVIACIEGSSGMIQWIRKYETYPYKIKRKTIREKRRWENRPPIVIGGIVYVCPQDTNYIFAIDAINGNMIWSTVRQGSFQIIANTKDLILLGGNRIVAINRFNGKIRWRSPKVEEKRTGLYQMNEKAMIFSSKKTLSKISLEDGIISPIKEMEEEFGNSHLIQVQDYTILSDSLTMRCYSNIKSKLESINRVDIKSKKTKTKNDVFYRKGKNKLKETLLKIVHKEAENRGVLELEREKQGIKEDQIRLLWRTLPRGTTGISDFMRIVDMENNRHDEFCLIISHEIENETRNSFYSTNYNSINLYSIKKGKKLWSIKFDDILDSETKAFKKGNLIYLKTRKTILAININDGDVKWSFKLESIDKDILGLVEPKSHLEVNLENLALKIDRIRRNNINERNEINLYGLEFGFKKLFTSSSDGRFICIDLVNGKIVWEKKIKEKITDFHLLSDDKKLLLVSELPIQIQILDPGDGRILTDSGKETGIMGQRIIGKTTYSNETGNLLFLTENQKLYSYNVKKNGILWEEEIESEIREVKILQNKKYIVCSPPQWSTTHTAKILRIDTGKELELHDKKKDEIEAVYMERDFVYVVFSRGFDSYFSKYNFQKKKRIWEIKLPKSYSRTLIVQYKECIGLINKRTPVVKFYNKLNGDFIKSIKFSGSNRLNYIALEKFLCFSTDSYISVYGGAAESLTESEVNNLFGAENEIKGRVGKDLFDFSSRLFQLGESSNAIDVLDYFLNREHINNAYFNELHDQLTAIQANDAQSTQNVISIRKLFHPPEIDGDLTDTWLEIDGIPLNKASNISRIQGMDNRIKAWRGKNDLSAMLYLGWDEKHLYIAVDVNDDVSQSFSSESDVLKGDGLIIAIDPHNDGGYGFDGKDYVITQALMRKKPKEDKKDNNDPGGLYAIKQKADGTGIIYESAIPWESIGDIKINSDTKFRFNIFVLDDDSGRGSTKGLSWSPGFYLHKNRMFFSKGYIPEYFGVISLEN